MEFSLSLFRQTFKEFNDPQKYSDEMITFWANLASVMVSQTAWTTQWNYGVGLYVAHEIVLARNNLAASSFGGNAGTFGGIATQKTVGGGSVQYDAQSTTEGNAGWWNLTNYGKQFIRLARIFGAGCIQL